MAALLDPIYLVAGQMTLAHLLIALTTGLILSALRRHVERLDTLTHLTTMISRALDMEQLLKSIADASATLMDVAIVQLWVADEDARCLHLKALSNSASDIPFRMLSIPYGHPASATLAVRNREHPERNVRGRV